MCTQLCVYAFRNVQIASYDVVECNIDMIVEPEEVD